MSEDINMAFKQAQDELAMCRQALRRAQVQTPELTVYRDFKLMHPKVRGKFIELAKALEHGFKQGATRTRFLPFETWRSPARQNYLYAQPERITNAEAWESDHQYGIAADFVPKEKNMWSWAEEHDYGYLKAVAGRYGLSVPIAWDRVHVTDETILNRLRGVLL